MGSSSGKVALVTNTTTLSGSCPSSASIVDFVSYGGSSPTCYEGTAAAATLSNTTAALRNTNGCTDTNQNSADFTELAPNPRNSASATNICPGVDTSAPTISSKSANPSIISPNGDSIKDSTTISFDITENLSFPVSWTVKIKNSSSTVVRTLSGSVSANGTVNVGWDGKNDSNVVVPDGTYSTEITATDSSSNPATSDPTIVVDNTAPDNYHDTFTGANFVSGSVAYVKSATSISVIADDGSGSGIAGCTLQIDSGATNGYTPGTNFTIPSPEGSHSFKVTCTDNVSNTSVFNQTVIVDDTPPSVALNAPNGGETIVAGSTFSTTWTLCAESGSGSGLSSMPIALSYSTDGGSTFPNLIATGEANDGLYSWNTPGSVNSTSVRVKIACSDNLGNAAMDTSNANFTLAPGAAVTATKEATNLATGSTTVFRAGDTIQYTVVLTNTGGLPANNNSGPEFIDQITSSATVVVPNTGATASSGTISYNISTRTYSWDGSIPSGGSITLTFSVRILSGLLGTIRVCNQGMAFVDTDFNGSSETQVLTVDPTPLSGAPGTQTCVDVVGKSDCFKLACLSVTGLKEVWVERARALRFEALGEDIKEINVQVFSLKGERIYQSGWVENGYEWRMDNGEGRRIANGVYLYVVTVRGYDGKVMQTQIKKLVIAR
ncbi:DUF11 domain-containing protein, partial [Candidatus Acetothermia bacterium]|nr:DUF11 domain-containing protein [Candidatus Acetothermia bacterium]